MNQGTEGKSSSGLILRGSAPPGHERTKVTQRGRRPPRHSVTVSLGDRSYRVHIGLGLLEEIGPRLARMGFGGPAALITQKIPGTLYGDQLLASLRKAGISAHMVLVPEGEEAKTLRQAARLYDFFVQRRFDRWSPVLSLGGGTVGDLAGFAAGTFMRGMPFLQIPTTLVSQVDSSVGGKTAVNHPRAKNLIGVFHQPRAVFIDPSVLKTLPRREMRAGLAEVIRYAAIADGRFFSFLERHATALGSGALVPLERAVRRSVAIKARIVSLDEREEGDIRALLNYGHTLGHAVEAATGYDRFRHGEAVALGMAAAARLAYAKGICSRRVMERQIKLLKGFGLPVTLRGVSPDIIINYLKLDKKIKHGRTRFVLTQSIGDAKVFTGLETLDLVGALFD